MNKQKFSLQPFNSRTNIDISGQINRYKNNLTIKYTLAGKITEILISEPKNKPNRQHNLWQTTCFEFFLAIKDSLQYWEFNLSPNGDWNIYRFDNYRQGMKEETAFRSLPFLVRKDLNSFNLYLEFELAKIVNKEQEIEVAIATVIKTKDSEITYWALNHPSQEADFHHRDSFLMAF